MCDDWTVQTAIKQIESCDFECIAGPLENNAAWRWLKEKIVRDIEHGDMVRALVKKPGDIIPQLTEDKVDLIHAIMGISGEAGELLDAIKKATIYDKPLDRTNVVEELGDLEFYMEQLRQRLSITREETLDANIDKLRKRYDGLVYSDQAAHARADKS